MGSSYRRSLLGGGVSESTLIFYENYKKVFTVDAVLLVSLIPCTLMVDSMFWVKQSS